MSPCNETSCQTKGLNSSFGCHLFVVPCRAANCPSKVATCSTSCLPSMMAKSSPSYLPAYNRNFRVNLPVVLGSLRSTQRAGVLALCVNRRQVLLSAGNTWMLAFACGLDQLQSEPSGREPTFISLK